MYILNTWAERTDDTVEFFPAHTKVPRILSADAARHAVKDLITVLEKPSLVSPFAPIGDITLAVMGYLANIFQGTFKVDEQKAKSNTATPMQPAATSTESAPDLRVVEEISVPRVQEPSQTEVAPKEARNNLTNIPFEDREYVRLRV